MIINSSFVNTWTLRLLLTQLYDPATEVCEKAAHFLEEACESMEALRLVVAMQPVLDQVGAAAHGLLLRYAPLYLYPIYPTRTVITCLRYARFLSTPMGFRYLFDNGYIDRELDAWFNVRYFIQV